MDEKIVGQPQAGSCDLAEIKGLLRELVQEAKKTGGKQGRVVDSPWLTAKEAAEYLKFSVNHFRKIAKDHQIPVYQPNRYRREDLDNFMFDNGHFKKPVGRARIKWREQTSSSQNHKNVPQDDGRFMAPLLDFIYTLAISDQATFRPRKRAPQPRLDCLKAIQEKRRRRALI